MTVTCKIVGCNRRALVHVKQHGGNWIPLYCVTHDDEHNRGRGEFRPHLLHFDNHHTERQDP